MSEPPKDMRNPFRSEADAFRVLVIIMAAAAVVIAAAVLVGTWLGALLALIGMGAGLYVSIGWLRAGLQERPETEAEGALRSPAPASDKSPPSS